MRPALLLGILAVISATQSLDAPPVKLHLFYDCMCSYSRDFVNNQLYPTWTEIKDIMDVEMFPFGNIKYASTGNSWSFSCQHGNDECQCNMIHACAKAHFKDITLEMEFVRCMLSANYPPTAGPTCAAQVGVEWNPLDTCINSEEGVSLLHDLALQQQKLEPELYFVPWIIINDVFSLEQTEECKNDLKRVICERYNGTPPSACEGYPAITESLAKVELIQLYDV